MTTIEFQRKRLEDELIAAKQKITLVRNSRFPDINTLNQLQDTVERNLQLIGMIDHHINVDRKQRAR